jgi:hypothetical protein
MVVNAAGMMIGLPVDEEELAAQWYGEPRPRGPMPVLPAPAGPAPGAAPGAAPGPTPGPAPGPAPDGVPPGARIIGRPGPHDRRYAIGRDHVGPVIHGLDPLVPRGDAPPSPPAPS